MKIFFEYGEQGIIQVRLTCKVPCFFRLFLTKIKRQMNDITEEAQLESFYNIAINKTARRQAVA